MIVLIVATFSYTRRAGLNTLGQDALLSHRASLKRGEEPGALERRCDPALSSIPRKALLIVGVRVMRSTNDMVEALARSGCSTFCYPEHGYGNDSASMRMLNGSPALYHRCCSDGILVRSSERRDVKSRRPRHISDEANWHAGR